MNKDPLQLLNFIAQALFDKKGFNIVALDVRKLSTMTDFFLIAEASVDRHLIALGKTVIELLEAEGEKPIYMEGLNKGEWVVLDYGELVIHILLPDMRDKYRLEELWQKGEIVDLKLLTHESVHE